MPERRRYPRFVLSNIDVHGRILFSNPVDILNISVGGVLLNTERQLNIGRSYMLRFEGKGQILTVPAVVIRSELSGSMKDSKGQIIPVYTSGMTFISLSSEKIREIADFIRKHVIDYQHQETRDMLKINDLRLYVRFHIQTPDKAIVLFDDTYKVEKISLGGMLIESEHALETEDKLHMELALSENEKLQLLGRVTSCLKKKETKPATYQIGIEFMEMPEPNWEILRSFVNTISLQHNS